MVYFELRRPISKQPQNASLALLWSPVLFDLCDFCLLCTGPLFAAKGHPPGILHQAGLVRDRHDGRRSAGKTRCGLRINERSHDELKDRLENRGSYNAAGERWSGAGEAAPHAVVVFLRVRSYVMCRCPVAFGAAVYADERCCAEIEKLHIIVCTVAVFTLDFERAVEL